MRPDMFKVVVEKPRRGRGASFHDFRRRLNRGDSEDLPRTIGMRAPYIRRWMWAKSLNENLNPLRRFLEGSVGHPWNEVFREICVNIRTDNAVQKHLRDHVDQFVEMNVVVDADGTPRRKPSGDHPLLHGELYVDPVDGLLKRAAGQPWRPDWTPPATNQRTVDGRTYRKDAGLWFEITHERTFWFDRERRIQPLMVVERRRSLSRKELRALGLENDPDAGGTTPPPRLVDRRHRRVG